MPWLKLLNPLQPPTPTPNPLMSTFHFCGFLESCRPLRKINILLFLVTFSVCFSMLQLTMVKRHLFQRSVSVPCWELPSLGEMRASNLVATRSREFVNFTARNLCRVYPSAYRIDSSNYSPQPMWNCGCQLGELLHKFVIFLILWMPSSILVTQSDTIARR